MVVLLGIVNPMHHSNDALAQDFDATRGPQSLDPGHRAVAIVVEVIVIEDHVVEIVSIHGWQMAEISSYWPIMQRLT